MRRLALVLFFLSSFCSAADYPSLLSVWSRGESVLVQLRALGQGKLEVWRFASTAKERRVWRRGIEQIYVSHNRLFAVMGAGSKRTLQEFELTDERSTRRLVTAGALGSTAISVAGVPMTLPIVALMHNEPAVTALAEFLRFAAIPGVAIVGASLYGCDRLLRSTPRFRPAPLRRASGLVTPVEIVEVIKNSVGAIDDIVFRDAAGFERRLNEAIESAR